MSILQWFIFFLAIQIVHYLGTWKLYQKAGRKSWEAGIPVYNAIVLMKIINRPTWWTALLFVPVVNLIMFIVVWVETLRSFGKNTTKDTILGVVTLGFYIYYINYFENVEYKRDRSLVATTKAGDTISSLLYAIVVATLVHTYVIQPFNIPTSSLEKSLLIGDFLFVSKFHYGAKTPRTAVALPMVHDSIPLTKMKSYLSVPQLPSFRFPGLQEIKRNDIVVFNWPVDTVYQFFDRSGRHIDKPKDKRSNYVKRCVGIAGDNLSIKNGDVYINNKKSSYNQRTLLQYQHKLTLKEQPTMAFFNEFGIDEINNVSKIKKELWDNPVLKDFLKDNPKKVQLFEFERDNSEYVYVYGGANDEMAEKLGLEFVPNKFYVNLTQEKLTNLSKDERVLSVSRFIHKNEKKIFPHNQEWSQDNLGPIYIPKAGKLIALNKENLPFYKRLITIYEGNKLEEKGGQILINDKPTLNYTFKQDYYWMMGDNRHNSEDSRYWGFVPFDHVVGKPVFIWWSLNQNIPWSKAIDKIRWERLFSTVGGDGEPVSYFKYFLILLVGWFGFDFYRKRRKG
ncbi:signal peptidase I [Flavobacterium sp.]|uniref:signal peptidase I n=1 Tax=Flavobacterium sp. TaxID=239 RepID=UPI00286E8393|nr:signal peptidase I [Flavobacterium sp.]